MIETIIVVNTSKEYEVCLAGLELCRVLKENNINSYITYALSFKVPRLEELINISWNSPGVDKAAGFGNCLAKIIAEEPYRGTVSQTIHVISIQEIQKEIDRIINE